MLALASWSFLGLSLFLTPFSVCHHDRTIYTHVFQGDDARMRLGQGYLCMHSARIRYNGNITDTKDSFTQDVTCTQAMSSPQSFTMLTVLPLPCVSSVAVCVPVPLPGLNFCQELDIGLCFA